MGKNVGNQKEYIYFYINSFYPRIEKEKGVYIFILNHSDLKLKEYIILTMLTHSSQECETLYTHIHMYINPLQSELKYASQIYWKLVQFVEKHKQT